jgi:hypothetical protein
MDKSDDTTQPNAEEGAGRLAEDDPSEQEGSVDSDSASRSKATSFSPDAAIALHTTTPRKPTLVIPTQTLSGEWTQQVQRILAANPDTIASLARIREMMSGPAMQASMEVQRRAIEQLVAAAGPVAAQLSYANQRIAQALQPLFRNTYSRFEDFTGPTRLAEVYSPELKTPGSFFERHEVEIRSFDELHLAIAGLVQRNDSLNLVWRGQQRASWGVHSGIYRALMARNKVIAPERNPKKAQLFPEESEVRAAESVILKIARSQWRFDDVNALELFARLQHHGAPTRLIDVTRNPYIAAWFAVERHDEHDGHDARLFAVSTAPVLRPDDDDDPETNVQLDDVGAARVPFWHHLTSVESRQSADWGTGSKRRIWVPPAYDERIVAQNAAFLMDGVPIAAPKLSKYFMTARDGRPWNKNDLLAASSMYMKTYQADKRAPYNKHKLAPTFSFRITAEAKTDIRNTLERQFLYNASTLYPDVSGLARYVRDAFST